MTKSSAEEAQFYSDGKNMMIAVGGYTYFLKDVLLESISTICERDMLNIDSFGSRKSIPGLSSTSFELKLKVCNDIEVSDKVNLSDFKMASSMTIRELFKVINKKLNKRKGK